MISNSEYAEQICFNCFYGCDSKPNSSECRNDDSVVGLIRDATRGCSGFRYGLETLRIMERWAVDAVAQILEDVK